MKDQDQVNKIIFMQNEPSQPTNIYIYIYIFKVQRAAIIKYTCSCGGGGTDS